jgi:GPH family glycoside/pentoside/hexuronide:cation symporter
MSGDTTPAGEEAGRALSFWQKLSFSLGNFSVGFGPATFAFLAYFYYGRENERGELQVLVPIAAYSTIWFLANALNGITDPLVGYFSDRTRSRLGRRKPYVLIGAPLLSLCFFYVWAPPDTGPTLLNQAVLFLSLFGYWLFFTVVVGPYLALLPEITPYNHERLSLSALMSVFGDVLGTLSGNLLPVWVALMAGWPFFTDGYRNLALVAAMVMCLLSMVAVLFVREKKHPPPEPATQGWLRQALGEFGSTFKNPVFPPYLVGVFFYRMSIMIVLTLTPFMATKIIGAYRPTEGDLSLLGLLPGVLGENGGVDWEQAAGYLMLLVLMGALLFFWPVSRAAVSWGKKRLFVLSLVMLGIVLVAMGTVGWWPVLSPFGQGLVLFMAAALPVAIALVVMRPLLADVIDADEKITHRRREGVYNGMEGLVMKVAAGLGPLVAGVVFGLFGHTVESSLGVRLCGPLAGLLLFVAAFFFNRYPIEK